MPVDEVTLAPNLEAVLFTPAVGKRGRHVDAFQTYHDFYKDELHIPQRRFDAGRLPTAIISMRINEMGLARPENPQLPRAFAVAARTSETAENAEIGL